MNEDPGAAKLALRRQMHAVRRALTNDERREKSNQIVRRFLQLAEQSNWYSLFVYVSYRTEVHTHELLRALLNRDAVVNVPKMDENLVMHAQRIDCWSELRPGAFGILEPGDLKPWKDTLDVCVAPGLAFTAEGERLGYGRGNYDQFLTARDNLPSVALAFDDQIVEGIPSEPHDWRMHVIVTETRVIECAK